MAGFSPALSLYIGQTYQRAKDEYENYGILNHEINGAKLSNNKLAILNADNIRKLNEARKPKQTSYAIYDTTTHVLTLNQNHTQRKELLLGASINKREVNVLAVHASAFNQRWDDFYDLKTTVHGYDALKFGHLKLVKIPPNSLVDNGMAEEAGPDAELDEYQDAEETQDDEITRLTSVINSLGSMIGLSPTKTN